MPFRELRPTNEISNFRPIDVPASRFDKQQINTPPQGLLEKASNLSESIFKTPRDFLFGTTGKAVGGLISSGIESATELAQGKKGPPMGPATQEMRKTLGVTPGKTSPLSGIGAVAGTALELYPGGGFAEDAAQYAISRLPKGEKMLQGIEKAMQYIPNKLKEKAAKQYAEALAPTTKEAKILTKQIVPSLIKRGVSMFSPGSLKAKAEEAVSKFGEEIGKHWDNLPEGLKINMRPVIAKLEEMKQGYIVEGKIVKEKAVADIESVQKNVVRFGKDASSISMRKLRQIFDENFDPTKGIEDISVYGKKAERAAADVMRDELAKVHPEIDKLNKEYTFWKNVLNVSSATMQKEIGKTSRPGKFTGEFMGGLAGFGAGSGIAQRAEFGALGSIIGGKALELFRGPGWKTVSAIQKNKLADLIATGKLDEAGVFLTKIAEGSKNLIQNQNTPPISQ